MYIHVDLFEMDINTIMLPTNPEYQQDISIDKVDEEAIIVIPQTIFKVVYVTLDRDEVSDHKLSEATLILSQILKTAWLLKEELNPRYRQNFSRLQLETIEYGQ